MDIEELYGPSTLTRARREVLAQTVTQIKRAYQRQEEWSAYVLFSSITELEEILWVQLQLSAPERESIKRFQRAERIEDERERNLSAEQFPKGRGFEGPDGEGTNR